MVRPALESSKTPPPNSPGRGRITVDAREKGLTRLMMHQRTICCKEPGRKPFQISDLRSQISARFQKKMEYSQVGSMYFQVRRAPSPGSTSKATKAEGLASFRLYLSLPIFVILINVDVQPIRTFVQRQSEQTSDHEVEIERY